MTRDPFFIGWSWRSARPIAWLLILVTLLVLGGLSGLALALGSSVDDPGGGDFSGDRTLAGVLLAEPYPVLITDPDSMHPMGHAVLLAGGGKIGVQKEIAGWDGRRVAIQGLGVRRGSIDMVLAWDIQPADGAASLPTPQPVGSWRLTGAICDGKCYSGAMRPGSGLAHKACANICLLGGVPPVLVTTEPVAGASFLLMADRQGHPLPDAFRDHTAILQRMDGTVSRVADLLIFHTDIAEAHEP